MSGNSVVDMYMLDMKRETSLLSYEQEVNVATAAQNGDLAARDKMVNSNLRLVVAIANKYQHIQHKKVG